MSRQIANKDSLYRRVPTLLKLITQGNFCLVAGTFNHHLASTSLMTGPFGHLPSRETTVSSFAKSITPEELQGSFSLHQCNSEARSEVQVKPRHKQTLLGRLARKPRASDRAAALVAVPHAAGGDSFADAMQLAEISLGDEGKCPFQPFNIGLHHCKVCALTQEK